MMDAFLIITEPIQRQNVSRISIPNATERAIFPLLDFLIGFGVSRRKRIRYLNIGVIPIVFSIDKIAFSVTDFSNAYLISIAD